MHRSHRWRQAPHRGRHPAVRPNSKHPRRVARRLRAHQPGTTGRHEPQRLGQRRGGKHSLPLRRHHLLRHRLSSGKGRATRPSQQHIPQAAQRGLEARDSLQRHRQVGGSIHHGPAKRAAHDLGIAHQALHQHVASGQVLWLHRAAGRQRMQPLPVRHQAHRSVRPSHRPQLGHQHGGPKCRMRPLEGTAHEHLPRMALRVQQHRCNLAVQRHHLGWDVSPEQAAQLVRQGLHSRRGKAAQHPARLAGLHQPSKPNKLVYARHDGLQHIVWRRHKRGVVVERAG